MSGICTFSLLANIYLFILHYHRFLLFPSIRTTGRFTKHLPLHSQNGENVFNLMNNLIIIVTSVLVHWVLGCHSGLSEQHHWSDAATPHPQQDQPPHVPYQLFPWRPITKVTAATSALLPTVLPAVHGCDHLTCPQIQIQNNFINLINLICNILRYQYVYVISYTYQSCANNEKVVFSKCLRFENKISRYKTTKHSSCELRIIY